MCNQYPIQDTARFVYTGISTIEVNDIVDMCEEIFGFYYDYVFFIDKGLDCYYFFPDGFRFNKKEFKIEEVENLDWH